MDVPFSCGFNIYQYSNYTYVDTHRIEKDAMRHSIFFVPLKLVGSRKPESNQLEIIFDFYNVKIKLGNLNKDFQKISIDWTFF